MDRDETIKTIRAALKRRSGKTWSVTGGRGTAYGWIRIDVPPARRIFDFEGKPVPDAKPDSGYMSLEEREELGKLLGLGKPVHAQGESIASGGDYYQEYIDRAEGREPTKFGKPYWD